METIRQFQENLENQPDQIEALERFHGFLEKLQKSTAYDVREVVIDSLDTNVAGDFHRSTKVVRTDKELVEKSIAANDMNFLEHVIHHEFIHKKFEIKSHGIAIIDNDINEAATEIIAGEKSGQGAQTYASERAKLEVLQSKSGTNIISLFKQGKSEEINKIITANDENYAIAA